MSNCMYSAQGDFVCNEDTNDDTIEHFKPAPKPKSNSTPASVTPAPAPAPGLRPTIIGPDKRSCFNCSNTNNILKCNCPSGRTALYPKLNLSTCTRNNNNTINVIGSSGKLSCD